MVFVAINPPPLLPDAPKQGGFMARVEKAQNLVQNLKDLYLRKIFAASRQNRAKTRVVRVSLLCGIALTCVYYGILAVRRKVRSIQPLCKNKACQDLGYVTRGKEKRRRPVINVVARPSGAEMVD